MIRALITYENKQVLLDLTRYIENQDLGINVIGTAQDEEKFLRLVKNYKPELIIVDMDIPQFNNIKFIKKVHDLNSACIIVIISDVNKLNFAQQAIKYDVFLYLTKPVNYDALNNLIRKSMNIYTKLINANNLLGVQNPDEYLVSCSISQFINANYNNTDMSIKLLEKQFNLSRSSICKRIKNETGLSFSSYLTKLRIENAKLFLINETNYSIKTIADIIGYTDQHYFSHAFKSNVGLTPLEYRKTNTESCDAI